jgi:hypothetical protein
MRRQDFILITYAKDIHLIIKKSGRIIKMRSSTPETKFHKLCLYFAIIGDERVIDELLR